MVCFGLFLQNELSPGITQKRGVSVNLNTVHYDSLCSRRSGTSQINTTFTYNMLICWGKLHDMLITQMKHKWISQLLEPSAGVGHTYDGVSTALHTRHYTTARGQSGDQQKIHLQQNVQTFLCRLLTGEYLMISPRLFGF